MERPDERYGGRTLRWWDARICAHQPQQPIPHLSADHKQLKGRIHWYGKDIDMIFYCNAHNIMYMYTTTYIYAFLPTYDAPPCRTTHARDAAGAAPNLGAIHQSLCVPPAIPLPTSASSARNVPVGPLQNDVHPMV
jgi:hypothetical protein